MPALLTNTCSGALRLRQRSANARTERSDARSSCSTCVLGLKGWRRVDGRAAGGVQHTHAQFANSLCALSICVGTITGIWGQPHEPFRVLTRVLYGA